MYIVQLLSHVQLFATPRTTYSMPSSSVLHHLPEFAQIYECIYLSDGMLQGMELHTVF